MSQVKARKLLVRVIFGVFEYADSNCLDRYLYNLNMPRIIFSVREVGKNIHLITTCCMVTFFMKNEILDSNCLFL